MNWLQQVFLILAQSRAPLYHSTDVDGAYHIIKENTLKTSHHDGRGNTLSLTRNKRYGVGYDDGNGIRIRFEIDQEKLRQNYKLVPWSWKFESPFITEKIPKEILEMEKDHKPEEYEELVYRDIKNFDRYVNKMSIMVDRGYVRLGFFPKTKTDSNLVLDGTKIIKKKLQARTYEAEQIKLNNIIAKLRYINRYKKNISKKLGNKIIKEMLPFLSKKSLDGLITKEIR